MDLDISVSYTHLERENPAHRAQPYGRGFFEKQQDLPRGKYLPDWHHGRDVYKRQN